MATFRDTLAQLTICKYGGGAQEQVSLYQTDADSRHQTQPKLRPEHHTRCPVTMREHNAPKSTVFQPDMHTFMLRFPMLDVSNFIHIASSASNMYKFPVQYRFWSRPEPDHCNVSFHTKHPANCNYAGYTTKNLAFQPNIFGPSVVSEF